VGVAVDFHLRLLDTGRADVEESQLARALLGRIAEDLRSAVPYDPIDAEKLLEGLELPTEGLDELAEEAGLEAGEEIEDAEDELANLGDAAQTPSVPGLYGDMYSLRVDTSRLPRPDQYGGMLVETGGAPAVDVVSDVKTVVYYVEGDLLARTAAASGVSQGQSGLYRRESDRATTAYAEQHGLLANLDEQLSPIAPEVASIEFLYFDGAEVCEEWDSIERGGLPMAVQITLKIIPQPTEEGTEEESGETSGDTSGEPDAGGESSSGGTGAPSGGGAGGGGLSGGGGSGGAGGPSSGGGPGR